MSYQDCGIAWITSYEVYDWLRTTSDNDVVIGGILAGLPTEISIRTGVDEELIRSVDCPQIVRQLLMFMLAQRFDYTETTIDRVVESLTKACQCLIYGD